MDAVIAIIGALVSLGTLLGLVARLTGPERARRRALQSKEHLDNAPTGLRPAFERMHWEASVHLAAITLSAASYGRHLGVWATTAFLSLLGVGVFAAFATIGADWDSATSVLKFDGLFSIMAIVFILVSLMTVSTAAAIEGSRRHFYSAVFDSLYARVEPDSSLLEKARTRDNRKGFFCLALMLAGAMILSISVLGINIGLSLRGITPGGIVEQVIAFGLPLGVVGVGASSWLLLFRWGRRPLGTLFSTSEVKSDDELGGDGITGVAS